MIETAMVFDRLGYVIHWHEPVDRSSGHIADSRSLWDVLWANRDFVEGVAHTHPWEGASGPSHTDMTTFSAVEKGLGRRFIWPIVTLTHVSYHVRESTSEEYRSVRNPFEGQRRWEKSIEELRNRTRLIVPPENTQQGG